MLFLFNHLASTTASFGGLKSRFWGSSKFCHVKVVGAVLSVKRVAVTNGG
jgi:hypothetical protein